MQSNTKGKFNNYLELLDVFINEYVGKVREEEEDNLSLGPYCIEVSFKKYVFSRLAFNNESKTLNNSIINKVLSQIQIENFLKVFKNNLTFPRLHWPSNQDKNLHSLMLDVYAPLLEPHRQKITYYALHERFLTFMLPVLSRIPHEIVVICESPIPDDLEHSDNIYLIELDFQWIQQYKNEYLIHSYPDFLVMFNNLELFISLLEPSTLLVIEGNHYQFELLAILGENRDIPVICIQQGWPGILTTQFKEMQFSHFLSWGDGFSDILRINNPKPKYISTGYPFKIEETINRNGIAFFLQAPILVSNKQAHTELLELIVFCAQRYPDRAIYVREHPEFPLNKNDIRIEEHKNIEFVPPNSIALSKVFSNSIVAISIFSSTLMEALIYGTIPLIYNPDLMNHYCPDLHKDRLGIEVNSFREAKIEISSLIDSPDYLQSFAERIEKVKHYYYASHDETSLEHTARTIMDINRKYSTNHFNNLDK